jgi:hypothetical protein
MMWHGERVTNPHHFCIVFEQIHLMNFQSLNKLGTFKVEGSERKVSNYFFSNPERSSENKESTMRILGIILIIWGIADWGLSWTGVDVWWEIGIELSDAIYPFTHWISMGVGYLLFKIAGSNDEVEEVQE